MANGRYNLASEFPQEKVCAAQTVTGDAFAVPPLDGTPMQQVVRPEPQRALERAVRRIFHDATGKKADHHTGDDFAVMARKEQPTVFGERKDLVKFILGRDRQSFATRPVDTDCMIC